MVDNGIILGISGIVATIVVGIGVGVVIFKLQARADSKINSIIIEIEKLSRQQSEIMNEEKRHRDRTNNYFVHHTNSSLELIRHQYEALQRSIADLTSDGSEQRRKTIIEMCKFYSRQFHEYTFPFVESMLQTTSDSLGPRVANKYIDTLAGVASTFDSIIQNPDLLESNPDLERISVSIKNQLKTINNLMDMLNEERAGQ